MRHKSRNLGALILGFVLLVSACGGDDDDTSPDTTATTSEAQAGPSEAAGTGVHELVALSSDSEYVQALCSIDFFPEVTEDQQEDPMDDIIEQIRALPTSRAEENNEVEWMVARLEAFQATEDPATSDDLPAVAAVMRARCS